MPYKYIGRKTDFLGKTLWEIVGNLKNFGVGRVVVRSRFERYPEPSYMKILKVEPLLCPEEQTIDDCRKVRVLVEHTFRGQTKPKPVQIEAASYKTDYRLLSKDEEANYCKKVERKNERILPKTIPVPVLLNELLVREQKARGEPVTDHRMEMLYKTTNNYKVAEKDEEATVSFTVGLGDTPNKSLYANVKK